MMITFRTRRILALSVTLAALTLVWLIAWLLEGRLDNVSVFTGATTLGAIVGLALLGVRRRLPALRFGSASTWTQIHIYTGIFATGVYFMHVPTIIAGGVFESGLASLFLLVSASGLYGVYASRTLPKRLTSVEGQHRFDRVGWHRQQIAETAKSMLGELNESAGIVVLKSFYQSYLSPFFETRPSLAYVIAPHGARRRRLLSGLKELDRYLESEGRSAAGHLAALVRRRDDLDYQYAMQLRLRVWLVVHGVFSTVLLAAATIHAIVAWRFVS